MLKRRLHKFRFDVPVRFRDIAEKQVTAKLKPIVGESSGITYDYSPVFCSEAILPWRSLKHVWHGAAGSHTTPSLSQRLHYGAEARSSA